MLVPRRGKTPSEQENSSSTEAASAGTAEWRREWHFRDPAASERVTSPATGINLMVNKDEYIKTFIMLRRFRIEVAF